MGGVKFLVTVSVASAAKADEVKSFSTQLKAGHSSVATFKSRLRTAFTSSGVAFDRTSFDSFIIGAVTEEAVVIVVTTSTTAAATTTVGASGNGAVIGTMVGLAIVVALALYLRKKRRRVKIAAGG